MSRRLLLAVVLGLALTPFSADARAEKPATVSLGGYGFWGNRQLKKILKLVEPAEKPTAVYDANFVEDAAVVLLAKLAEDGYLKPRLEVRLTLANGTKLTHTWQERMDTFLPRPLAVKRVQFRVRRGVRYYYRQLEITGLRALKPDEARRYFVETELLIPVKATRIYTPTRLKQSVANLTEAHMRKGYEQAKVTVTEFDRNDRTGAVLARVAVAEGLPTRVRSVRVEVYGPGEETPRETEERRPSTRHSRYWAQDFIQQLRAEQFRKGYPDATAELKTVQRDAGESVIELDLLARVQTGPRVKLGEVKFEGLHKTRPQVVRERVKLKQGEPLDRLAVDNGRERLARLGVFDTVDVKYEDVDANTRHVLYNVKEGKTIDLSLLLGYGSYELLRGGFELEQYNLFGRAHSSRLRVMQSFKSTSADYRYTMPELIADDIDVFFQAFGLRREEISFTREEYGASVGAQRHFDAIDSDIGVRYAYQFLDARDADATLTGVVEQARVAAIVLDFKHDQRDNPLSPRQGYKVFTALELASQSLGGEVDYQRLDLTTSFHRKIGRGRFLHLGLSHGALLTLGGAQDEIPFNKRFFPGGENSIRGFQEGEAAPRNADGKIIGAETYLLGNVELEQVLTPAWSLVGFVDAIGFAANIHDYPFDETLISAGGGLRLKTIIGPARIEYGRNLNPRRRDPAGTLHISIGFPF